MKMSKREVVVFVTTSSKKEAKEIGAEVVKSRLAACATVVSVVESIYRWQGKIHSAREALMIIKTTAQCYARLERQILALHSYEVPEIIALPIMAGSESYLDWIRKESGK